MFKHKWKDRQYKQRKQMLAEYKVARGCADCKRDFGDANVLTFDHVRGEKLFGIGQKWDVGMKALLEEVEKCDVVCHNCHALRTAHRLKDDPMFEPFPKIPRLFRDCTITEKIDGSNGTVCIDGDGDVYAAQRNGFTPDERDNHGFRGWVEQNELTLLDILGPGVHRGEWWGQGINRGYGLKEKRFSLFNTSKWKDVAKIPGCPSQLGVVPVLYEGPFLTREIEECLFQLRTQGSVAVPNFMDPEGIVVYHHAAGTYFKATILNDEKPKGSTEKTY